MKKIINLNPRIIEENKNNKKTNKIMSRICIIVVVILLLLSFPIKYINKVIQNNVEQLSNEVEKNSDVLGDNLVLKKEQKELELMIESITNINETRRDTSNIIEKINKHIPKSLKFLDFCFDENGLIEINGETSNYNAIPEFLANLEMSEDFTNIKLGEIITRKNNVATEKNPEENKSSILGAKQVVKVSYTFSVVLEEVNTYEKE
ncbi:MAG: PilN domain-containing protein [Clostridium sp.]